MFLTIPGYTGSGPQHWQSLWEAADSRMSRVEQEDWHNPDPRKWAERIDAAVREAGPRVILVAHSCGSIAVAHWAARFNTPVAGAFLVAPPDFRRPDLAKPVRAFGLPVVKPLPFPAVVVASENDPFCASHRAAYLATAWGASLVTAGRAGHINTRSGHGPWPDGLKLLSDFQNRICALRTKGSA